MKTVKMAFDNLSPAMIDGEKQGPPMDIAEAAGRKGGTKVNPRYRNGGRYEENCQSCIVAYEMRRRGYDIEAKALTPMGDLLAQGVQMAFIDPKTGDIPELKRYVGPSDTLEGKTAISGLASAIGELVKPGERWALVWYWAGHNGGHVVSLDRPKGGKLTLLDTQTGQKAVGASRFWPDYFSECPPIYGVYMFMTSGMALNPVFKGVLRATGQDSAVRRKPLTGRQIDAIAKALCEWFAPSKAENVGKGPEELLVSFLCKG